MSFDAGHLDAVFSSRYNGVTRKTEEVLFMKKCALAFLVVFSLCMIWLPGITVYGDDGWTAVTNQTSRDGLWRFNRLDKTIIRYYGDEETITIPRVIDGYSMEVIGEEAFAYCQSLKHVDLGDYIKTIETAAFAGCTNLKSVTSGRTVLVGREAFRDCTSLDTIGIQFGSDVIGACAFAGCTSLTSFTIPDNIRIIGDEAFKGCTGLKTILIKDNVKSLGRGAFAGCTNLDGIWAQENSTLYCNDENGVLFTKDKTWLRAAPGSLSGTYMVPDYVKKISPYAFSGCSKLETILIPDNVTSMGVGSFSDCTALKTVVLSGSCSTVAYQFKGCTALETIVSTYSFDSYVVQDCANLKSIYCLFVSTNQSPYAFSNVTATVYYMARKTIPSLQELQPYQFGGTITYVPLDNYCIALGDGSTYVVGSNIGAIFLAMASRDALVSVSVDGNLLSADQYLAMTKGTSIILLDAYLQTLSPGAHDLKLTYTDGTCEAIFILADQPGCDHELVIQEAVSPTCTQPGSTKGVSCAKCQVVFEEQKSIAPMGHDDVVTTVPPTCTDAGYDLYICNRCQREEQHGETAPIDHSFGEWKILKEPTYDEPGLAQRICSACGETQQQELEALTPPATVPPTNPPETTPTIPPTDPTETIPTVPPTDPQPTKPKPTEAKPLETTPLQPAQPVTTTPTENGQNQTPTPEPANLIPVIILGSVLLVATGAGVLYLFRKKS